MAETVGRSVAGKADGTLAPAPAHDAARRLLAAIHDNLDAGICLWDADLRLVAWNAAYQRINAIPADVLRAGARLGDILDRCAPLHNKSRAGAELEAMTREKLREKRRLHVDRLLVDGRIVSVSFHAAADGGWLAIYRDVTERRQAVQALAESERQLKLQKAHLDVALDSMAQGFSIWDEDRRLVVWNRRHAELHRIPADKLRRGMSLSEFCEIAAGAEPQSGERWEDLHDIYRQRFDRVLEPGSTQVFQRVVHGRTVDTTLTYAAGVGWIATDEDVTEHRAQLGLAAEREAELKQQNVRFEAAVNNMPVSLSMFDGDRRLVICNRRYSEIYRLPDQLTEPGTPLDDIIQYRLTHGTYPSDQNVDYFKRRLEIVTAGKVDNSIVELENGRTVLIRHQPLPDGGWVSTQEDITDRRRDEARISHLARHDPLTDLPNRSFFREQMDLAEARIRRGETMAVMWIDLDHFKGVNDTLGHSLGDAVLKAVANRLRTCTREVDVVARLGGDEFAVLLGALPTPEDAAVLAKRIVDAIAEPFDVQGHHVLIGASIGVAVAPADGRDADTLMKNSDLALYRAKGQGRGAYYFFEPGMDAAIKERRAVEVGLRLALSRNELRLVYQPLLSLTENRINGMEALLRWDHPDRGTVSPDLFIPVAEETGLIVPIGEWVLREACKAATSWPENIAVAVNISPAEFKNRNLIQHVTQALAESRLPAHRLEIEITEALFLGDGEHVVKVLHELRKIGVRVSMDDFGTGYSALSHLRSFPFDKIKIDRSFVRDLSSGGDTATIVKAVIGLGRSLGMATTAEGVETEGQLDLVRQQGCTEAQGFLFSPPLPAAAVSRLFAAASPATVLAPERRSVS